MSTGLTWEWLTDNENDQALEMAKVTIPSIEQFGACEVTSRVTDASDVLARITTIVALGPGDFEKKAAL